MLHIEREILVLAAQATSPPTLPAPPEIAAAFDSLVDAKLLRADPQSKRVTITDLGRAALGANAAMAAVIPSPTTP